MITLRCYEFIQAGLPNKCCESCHEDDELGYDMIFLEVEDHPEINAYVCCGMSKVIDAQTEPLRTLFAQALLARRKANREDP